MAQQFGQKKSAEQTDRQLPATPETARPAQQEVPRPAPASPEAQPSTPEVAVEVEKIESTPQPNEGEEKHHAFEGFKRALGKKPKKKHTQIPQVKDDITLQVEKILEEDLAEAYQALTPIQKQEFKIKGEIVAFEIRHLLKKTHVNVKKIFSLIVSWLKMLPGINRFFLEQEAKIKADRIVALKDVHKQP